MNKVLLYMGIGILVCAISFANDPVFTIPSATFNLTEDQTFTYLIEANDNDLNYPVAFSTNAQDILPIFNMSVYNSTAAYINFTPTNDEATHTYYPIYIIATDNASETDFIIFRINVINTNDPPNITVFVPESLTPEINENNSIGFTFDYNASDDDLIHPGIDNLSNSYYNNGNYITSNRSFTYYPGFCDAGLHNISLIVQDLYNASDSVVWNLTVNNTNRVPILNQTIENKTMNEDESLQNTYNLDNYFYDFDNIECTGSNKDPLNYSAQGNNSIIVIINSTTHNVTLTPRPNYWGTEIISFVANDGYNSTISNNIVITVLPINDAPEIAPIPNQTGAEFAIFTYQVIATDADNDTLTYSDNSTLFEISSTGAIYFHPNESTEGNYTINISVSDGIVSASTLFNLIILNNYPPAIPQQENQTIYESLPFTFYITAFDPDNDSIIFSDNSTMFDIVNYNSTTGYINFTAHNNDVGNQTVIIYATDAHGAQNFTTMYFSILDVNNPPVLTPIPNSIARVNFTFSLVLSATDLDDDVLNFSLNSTLFDVTLISATTAIINITPNETQIGNYTINVTVTDGVSTDSKLFNFSIIINSPPELYNISNQTATEDFAFIYIIQAHDNDFDYLSFSTNSTLFNLTSVNSTAAIINFTAKNNQFGNYTIIITVNDSYSGNDSIEFNLTILPFNDMPYFSPNLTNMTAFENIRFTAYITAYDEENANLTFWSNLTFINLTTINSTTGLISFLPLMQHQGNHTVKFNASDGNSAASQTITFSIRPINHAPNFTSNYPTDLNVTMYENSSQIMNITGNDADLDELRYYWLIDGEEQSNQYELTYLTNFTGSGIHNITAVLGDGFLNTSISWEVTVINVNRFPVFGKKYHNTYSQFLLGTTNNTNITTNGAIRLAFNGTDYYPIGYYNSTTINLLEDIYLNVTKIYWSEYKPSNTTITFQTRSGESSNSFGEWHGNYTASGSRIASLSNQYIQYRIILETNNTNVTPNVTSVNIDYIIANLSLVEKNYMYWIDLDDFFYDLDEDNITYNFSTNGQINVEINNLTHVVRIYSDHPDAVQLGFSAFDGAATAYSNNVTVVFEKAPSEIVITPSSGGGGGGGSSVIITKTKIINISSNNTKLVAFELIVPGLVTIYENETMSVPIKLINNENDTLKNITLNVSSLADEINMTFEKNKFSYLKPNETQETFLYVTSYKAYGSYEIIITATVEEPKYSDKVKFYINSLEKGAENKTQLNTKITFTRDFLEQNPECLELNELLLSAMQAIEAGELRKANILIDQFMEGCKYIISNKDAYLELPKSDSNIFQVTADFFKNIWERILNFFERTL